MAKEPREIVVETVASVQGWAPKTDAETDASSAAYEATIKYFEAMEHLGQYAGNGHHLAQRVAALVTLKLQEKGVIPGGKEEDDRPAGE